MKKTLTPEYLEKLCKELCATYSTRQDLEREIDELMYMLFYVEADHFSEREIRDGAFLLHTLKRLIGEEA